MRDWFSLDGGNPALPVPHKEKEARELTRCMVYLFFARPGGNFFTTACANVAWIV